MSSGSQAEHIMNLNNTRVFLRLRDVWNYKSGSIIMLEWEDTSSASSQLFTLPPFTIFRGFFWIWNCTAGLKCMDFWVKRSVCCKQVPWDIMAFNFFPPISSGWVPLKTDLTFSHQLWATISCTGIKSQWGQLAWNQQETIPFAGGTSGFLLL